tara:strand:+ start:179 stop:409 length:231 start_codon:yes stop_codon:yes gene_type:complete
MDSKTSSDITPTKNEVSETVVRSLLENGVKNGDDINAKLTQKTLEQVKYEQMAQNCFKHPENGRQLSYSEMRLLYD